MGFGRNSDKRGNTGGGSSTGRSGQKRGGKNYTGDQNKAVDQGVLTCGVCQGSGEVDRPHKEGDEEGAFDGADSMTCGTCGGSGSVKKK